MATPVIVPDAERVSRRLAGMTALTYGMLAVVALGASGVFGFFAYDSARGEARAEAHCRSLAYPTEYFPSLDRCLAMNRGGEVTQFGAIAAAALVVAAGAGALAVRARRKLHPFFQVLAEHPERVVWLYILEYHRRGGRNALGWGVNIGLIDGKTLTLPMRKQEAEPTMADLARQMPWVTVGYSQAALQAFRSNPAQLKIGG